jgi:hypothetical protein
MNFFEYYYGQEWLDEENKLQRSLTNPNEKITDFRTAFGDYNKKRTFTEKQKSMIKRIGIDPDNVENDESYIAFVLGQGWEPVYVERNSFCFRRKISS